MAKSTAEIISKNNHRRHANNTDQERCRHCKSYVDKGEPENGQVRYTCSVCQRTHLEWVGTPQNKSAKS